jgi:hypothetical protein
VTATKRAKKQIVHLPESVKQNLVGLIRDIENEGPVRGEGQTTVLSEETVIIAI